MTRPRNFVKNGPVYYGKKITNQTMYEKQCESQPAYPTPMHPAQTSKNNVNNKNPVQSNKNCAEHQKITENTKYCIYKK